VITVAPVRTGAELDEFVAYPSLHLPRDRYVPVWHAAIGRWHQGKGPHTSHGGVSLVLARDPAGTVVGRSTLHDDDRMDAKLGAMTQLMGLTDFTDVDALRALVDAAEEAARAAGRTSVFGPAALLPNQIGGVITSGFEHRGFLDSPWNPPHYPAAWETLGFERTFPGSTWICEDLAELDPSTIFGAVRDGVDGIELHRGDRRRLAHQLPLLRRMLNASFLELPYYTPISADELAVQTDGLAYLLDESLLLYVTRDDEPVAFVLVVPDLSEFAMRTGGRLNLVDQLRLLVTRGRYRREAILLVKGTVPGARGLGLMSLLSRELLTNLKAGGYRSLRVTFIGDDNAGSRAQFEAMGGRPLHGLTFYRRAVT